jgi:Arc/MetJ-type ribon-helix-helix transcriptional regulator
MKYKVSICVDEETLLKVRDGIRKGRFRNRSHAFEFSLNEIMASGAEGGDEDA